MTELHKNLDALVDSLQPQNQKIWAELRKRDDRADKLVENAKADLNATDRQLYSDVYTCILDNLTDDNAEELAALYSSFREYQTMRYTDMTQRLLECIALREQFYRRINSYLVK